jgi:dihydrofolate reductase
MISLISAMDLAHNIGLQGDMPWGRSMKKDLERFKELTDGKSIIMGRKTFKSLPGILPNRYHIVLAHKKMKIKSPAVVVANDFDKLLEIMKETEEEVFVIGGAQIYEQFLPHADRIYLTKIHELFDGDTKFPELNAEDWDITEGPVIQQEGDKYPSQYMVYDKK